MLEHLDWLVMKMLNRKKIILFIVEGINDKTSLALCLSQLLNDDEIHFEITDGDITTRIGTNPTNIAAKVGDIVKKHSGRVFKQNDYLEVVHLIDMDGAFVPDENVSESENGGLIYELDTIRCKDVSGIKKRNHQKQQVVNRMLCISKVWTCIPYSVYFFSCNMDHVLHNQANLSKHEKDKLAQKFEDAFIDKPQEFAEFFDDEQLFSGKSYIESWNFIRTSTNSLKRKTNFYLYIKEKVSKKMCQ